MAESSKQGIAHDGRALPWSVLTEDEKEKIRDINDLLRAIQKDNNKPGPARWGDKYNKHPWAMIDKHRTNRVIMIEGQRGAGKTSLLLTLMYGWLNPDEDELDAGSKILYKKVFEEMDTVIKPLTPLDFDPLPPDLSLYSWIIQAFEPLVAMVASGSDAQKSLDYTKSIRGQFRNLQNAAVIGWTVGLLKQNLGDLLTSQSEQQGVWQQLQNMWQKFLDELLRHLENIDGNILPKNALIAVPIDDLDLQAGRLRELLLVLRVLRHERVVYVLTGDEENMKVSLKADFYQSYVHHGSRITDGLADEIIEQVETLASSLASKVIPDSHLFALKGLRVADENAMDWGPGEELTLEKTLDALWPELELSQFIRERRYLFKRDHAIPFRKLQAFFDRWEMEAAKNRDLEGKPDIPDVKQKNFGREGIAKFLEIILDGSGGEKVNVNTSERLEAIEISSSRKSFAPVPVGSASIGASFDAEVHWMTAVDFAIMGMSEDNQKIEANAAGAFTFAIELAKIKSDVIRIVNGPEPTEKTLGFIWTQTRKPTGQESTIFPWPMIPVPKEPSQWRSKVNEWNEILTEYSGDKKKPDLEGLFKAWCKFSSNQTSLKPASPIKEHIEAISKLENNAKNAGLKLLCSPLSGLKKNITDEIKSVFDISVEDQKAIDLAVKSLSYAWKSAFVIPVDPFVLASKLLELQDDGSK
jgi:hypothetical protein